LVLTKLTFNFKFKTSLVAGPGLEPGTSRL
jgi:hypothetical protein